MPPCPINSTRSSSFRRNVKKLRKKCPKIDDDLAEAFAEIQKDYETANGAEAVPGFDRTVWKYRCGSRDMAKGRRSAFRIVAYHDVAENCLYPFAMYAKSVQANISPNEISELVKTLLDEQGDLPLEEEEQLEET